MELQTLFWNASLDEINRGYIFDKETKTYTCLLCGATFEKGIVYPIEEQLYDAHKMVLHHITKDHGSVFDYIISLNKKYTSLSEHQQSVLILIHQGKTDLEIARELKLTSSTIRNYRFKFREKEKQAKIFLSLMHSINNTRIPLENTLVTPHKGAKCIDDRYDISEQDRLKTLEHYFDEHGRLLTFPSKEKKKIIILTQIASYYKENVNYTEKEVNRILERIYEDYVLLRRYLIQYGFFDRSNDGSTYWKR